MPVNDNFMERIEKIKARRREFEARITNTRNRNNMAMAGVLGLAVLFFFLGKSTFQPKNRNQKNGNNSNSVLQYKKETGYSYGLHDSNSEWHGNFEVFNTEASYETVTVPPASIENKATGKQPVYARIVTSDVYRGVALVAETNREAVTILAPADSMDEYTKWKYFILPDMTVVGVIGKKERVFEKR